MALKKGSKVRARRDMGDVFRGYVRRHSVGEVIEVHDAWFGLGEPTYTVRFPGRTLNSLTADDIANA